jgi:hypothetical protein
MTSLNRGAMLCLFALAAAEEFTEPKPHAPAPTHTAPASPPVLVDLAPLHAKSLQAGFSNPFKQYEGGAIPGWHFDGDATLSNDFLALTSTAPRELALFVLSSSACAHPSSCLHTWPEFHSST